METTESSVGPYALNSARPGAQRCTSACGIASPPEINTRRPGSVAVSGSADSTTGGSSAWVMPAWATKLSSASPISTTPGAGMCSDAPCDSAISHSNTQASKLKDANCSTRLSCDTANRSACACSRLATPRCGTSTPFGRPVEPEV